MTKGEKFELDGKTYTVTDPRFPMRMDDIYMGKVVSTMHTFAYVQKHGRDALRDRHGASAAAQDAFYKAVLDSGKTWQEYTGFKGYDPEILL